MEDVDEFQIEDVEQVLKQSLQSNVTQDTQYDPEAVNLLSRNLLETCVKNLAGMGKPFKYVITITIMQKNGAGLCTAMGALWDGKKDGALRGALPPNAFHWALLFAHSGLLSFLWRRILIMCSSSLFYLDLRLSFVRTFFST